MSFTLADVSPHYRALLALDAKLALLPVISQIAENEDEVADARDYNKQLENALENPGAGIVLIAAEGDLASDDRKPVLDLWNTVLVAIEANELKNTTGLTGYQLMRRALRVLHRGNSTLTSGARAEVKLSNPAWQLGPLSKGKTVYFINTMVRTTEALGAVDPAP